MPLTELRRESRWYRMVTSFTLKHNPCINCKSRNCGVNVSRISETKLIETILTKNRSSLSLREAVNAQNLCVSWCQDSAEVRSNILGQQYIDANSSNTILQGSTIIAIILRFPTYCNGIASVNVLLQPTTIKDTVWNRNFASKLVPWCCQVLISN